MSSRNLIITPVLSAVESAKSASQQIPFSVFQWELWVRKLWVPKMYSSILGLLVADPNFASQQGLAHRWRTSGWSGCCSTMLDVEATFCYMVEMLCSNGGYDSVIDSRCCMAWGKLKKLLSALTRHLSSKVCVARCTWPASFQLCSMVAQY